MALVVKFADHDGLQVCLGCSEGDEDEEEIRRRGSSCCRIEGQGSEVEGSRLRV